jgi:hypothetical protein
LSLPGLLFAAGTTNSSTSSFCSSLSAYAATSEIKKSKQIQDRLTQLDKRTADLAVKRSETDQAVVDQHAKAIEKQNATYAKLLSQVKTDAQKNAANQFIEGAKQSLATRQNAVTFARNTFRDDFDMIMSQRKINLGSVLTEEKASIDRAVLAAKSACESGAPSATVRTNLKNSINTAHETFKTAIKNLGKIDDKIAPITQARKAANASAQDTFTKELDTLKTTFKSQVGSTKK